MQGTSLYGPDLGSLIRSHPQAKTIAQINGTFREHSHDDKSVVQPHMQGNIVRFTASQSACAGNI